MDVCASTAAVAYVHTYLFTTLTPTIRGIVSGEQVKRHIPCGWPETGCSLAAWIFINLSTRLDSGDNSRRWAIMTDAHVSSPWWTHTYLLSMENEIAF